MTRALLIVDIQQDYFPGGALPLVSPDAAAKSAAAVLQSFRDRGQPVVHVFHAAEEPDATFLRAGSPGAAIHPLVAPIDGEAVVEKHEPNSFVNTELQDVLAERGITELVVVGMMTSMCIDSTVRAASERGFAVTVVADACAAPDLSLGDVAVPGPTVHAAFLAALDGSFATVVPDARALEALPQI